LAAIIRPPMTANPVQIACPTTPPTQVPQISSRAASTTVASWDRSPHSAKKVMVKACRYTLENIEYKNRLAFAYSFDGAPGGILLRPDAVDPVKGVFSYQKHNIILRI